MNWSDLIAKWKGDYAIRTRPPLAVQEVRQQLAVLNVKDDGFVDLYCYTNGLSYAWFEMFCLFDAKDPKHTWKDLNRVNSPDKTHYLQANPELLQRFFVFATIGAVEAAVLDRTDGTIWYEEEGELHQTNLTLSEFVETSLREAKEL